MEDSILVKLSNMGTFYFLSMVLTLVQTIQNIALCITDTGIVIQPAHLT
ncbi:MAG: hypothetical protein ACYCQJ_09145 [Nitrososphaerales archaeon]